MNRMAAAACLLVFAFSLFTLTLQNQQYSEQHLVADLQEAKLKIARFESILKERINAINAKNNYLEERERLIDDLTHQVHHLQFVLSKLKDDSTHAEERLNVLEDEIRLLWAASRKNNFDIHNLEFKAAEAEDRLEDLTSQVQKTSEFVTEQWIQIQHLEQALHMTELRAADVQRQLMYSRCSFLKFVKDVSEKHFPKLIAIVEPYFPGKGSTLSSFASQAQQQFKQFLWAFKKFHHELQGFIKQEMIKNELTAALANEELVFFAASALITFPILAAWAFISSQFR